MLLTASQKRALRYILLIIGMAVIVRLADGWLNPLPPYDFSAFDQRFQARFDSIQQAYQSPPLPVDTPTRQPDGRAAAAESDNTADPLPVNINTASREALTRLPRIGPRIAERIIAYRRAQGPFRTKLALTNVKGIGPATLAKIRPLITVE